MVMEGANGDVIVNWRRWTRTKKLENGYTVVESGNVLVVGEHPRSLRLQNITISQGDTVIHSIDFEDGGAWIDQPDFEGITIG